ncbi:unnamed protein product [Polarella glacialis]|uniref:UDP-glucuronosyltransferase n=1 Tax=Polarella glacialis TaxID=89957 RepID=A0A813GZD5_POLGL|nr:unnamed protein product [Polarella glacialis]
MEPGRPLTVALASLPFVGHSSPLALMGEKLLQEGVHLQFLLSKADSRIDRCKSVLLGDERVQFVLVDDGIESQLMVWNTLPPGNCCEAALPAWIEAVGKLSPRPDILIADSHTFHAAYAADALGIPFALNVPDSFCLLFLLAETVVPQNLPELAMLFLTRLDVPFRRHMAALHHKARFHLATSFPAWEGSTAAWPENIFAVGPQGPRHLEEKGAIPPEFVFCFDDSKLPVVYVSTGSNFALTKKQCKILYRGLSKVPDVRYIWALRVDFQEALEAVDASRFHLVDWAPQKDILASPAVKAIVYHGGFNGICEALQEAKPLLLVPIEGDQFVNADNAVMKGVALQVNRDRFSAHEVAEKMQRLLSEPRFAEAAKLMQESIMSTGGAPKSVQVIKASILGQSYAKSCLNPASPRWSAFWAYVSPRVSCERRARKQTLVSPSN